MQTLVIDPRFGAAGDMLVAALLSLGADKNTVFSAIQHTASPAVSPVVRCGLEALSVSMNADTAHRTIDELLAKIDAADACPEAKELARKIFARIERAEARVHHTPHPHFHEIGADDAAADVLGACTALLSLSVDSVCVLPVATGFGTHRCAHGIMPVPAPATAEILRESDLEVITGSFEGELCTPTGAAILAEFAASFKGKRPTGKITAIGRGAGTREFEDHPNILTVYLVESADAEADADAASEPNTALPSAAVEGDGKKRGGEEGDVVDVLETNVDDITGELLADTIAVMMNEGARDASAVPVIMKKGRSGYLIRVICTPDSSARLARILAKQTGSLGIRCTPMVHRFTAERGFSRVTAEICGKACTVPVKYASFEGEVYSRKAEFEDCRQIAADTGCSVREVKRVFEDAAWRAGEGM